MKVGAEAAQGHAPERANGATAGGQGSSPPANGSGMRRGSRRRQARREGAVMRGAPRGFVPRTTEGWACLWHGGSQVPHTPPLRLQAPGSGSTLQLGQGDGQS